MKAIKIESSVKPKKFISLNNGVWYYNYDITEKTVKVKNSQGEYERVKYSSVQVRINGEPTPSKCYEAILKAYKDDDGNTLHELSMIDNTYKDLSDEIYYNVKVDFNLEVEISSLDKAKNTLLKKIDEYDKSSEVNSFLLNGIKVWLDKDTRVGLMNSLSIEKNAGKETSTLWFNNICITINCDAAIQMLSALELYALACYNKTAEHKVAIESMNSIDEINSYDYTAGYPEKLEFTI